VRVRCVKLIDEESGGQIHASPWLSVGKEYLVLEISMSEGESIKFRLLGDKNGTPALHDFSQFELVSHVIPRCWVVVFKPNLYFCLRPSAFAQPGFWERYFDGDDAARRTFNEVLRGLEEEDPPFIALH
jgi:hypothetical protein